MCLAKEDTVELPDIFRVPENSEGLIFGKLLSEFVVGKSSAIFSVQISLFLSDSSRGIEK